LGHVLLSGDYYDPLIVQLRQSCLYRSSRFRQETRLGARETPGRSGSLKYLRPAAVPDWAVENHVDRDESPAVEERRQRPHGH
jgi:hypothetical protein